MTSREARAVPLQGVRRSGVPPGSRCDASVRRLGRIPHATQTDIPGRDGRDLRQPPRATLAGSAMPGRRLLPG